MDFTKSNNKYMKKISKEMADCFQKSIAKKKSNTQVTVGVYYTNLILFDNTIATLDNSSREITISNCGYFTQTTKDRLNAIEGVSITQKRGVWHLNGQEWNGESKVIRCGN